MAIGQGDEGVDLTKKDRPPTAEEVEKFHTNAATDSRREDIHHTVGLSENQASPGNHNHRKSWWQYCPIVGDSGASRFGCL